MIFHSDNMRSTKDKVRYVLENHPNTRNSDAELIIMVWWCFNRDAFQTINGKWYIQVQEILYLDKPETIRRVRQKFQEQGKYVGEIKEERLQRAENIRKTINDFNWSEFLPK